MNLRNTLKKLFSGVILLLIFVGSAHAQSLQDIQNLKVDNLSDAQIEQLIRRAEASGLNEMQLEVLARERGMPMQETAKLRQRINQLRGGSGGAASSGFSTGGRAGMPDSLNVFDDLKKSDPYYDLTPLQKKIFGYKLFHNRNLNFNPSLNVPTPLGYVIGSGDELLIDVYGASQQSYSLFVTPEGKIFVPNFGPIQVSGSTMEAARSRIKTSLTRIFSGLSGSNPNTFLEVRLGNIRSISVAMVGELNMPGNYTLPSFASVFNALFAAGGPNENGSFRNIQVYRESKLVAEIDIYKFLISGDQGANVTLQDNDVVIVQPVRSRVEIEGSVRREGLFEIKEGESLENLLSFTGGFTAQAFQERLTIIRYSASEMRVEDVDAPNFSNYTPKDGDIIRIGKVLDRFENRVQITGALIRPGTFELTPQMTVSELIKKASGLREDAFIGRGTLYRTKGDFSLEIVPVDLESILNKSSSDILLQREDILNIPSLYDLEEEYFVKISGEINKPGTYPFGGKMTVSDLILKAGGFTASATSDKVEIVRRIKNDTSGKLAEIKVIDIDKELKFSDQSEQEILMPFDHIIIRKSPGFQRERFVTVQGEVYYPGDYALSKANERISDILNRAGGLNQFAFANGAILIRRSEFYKPQTEEQLRLENLLSLRENSGRDSLNNSESEKILISRVDQKINIIVDNMNKSSERRYRDRIIRSDTLRIGNEIIQQETKPTETVGIDLPFILNNPGSIQDLFLEEGDILFIPKEKQTVKVRGEVLFTNTIRFKSNKGLRHYVSSAGGFTNKAKRGRSYVVYANGNVKRTKKIFFVNNYPKIDPGAEIVVPVARDRRQLSIGEFVGVSSSLLTLYLLINATF